MASPDDELNSIAQPNEPSPTARGARGWTQLLVVVGAIAILLAIYSLIVLFSGNGPDPRYAPERTVNLDEPQRPAGAGPTDEASEQSSVRIAIAPVISPEKSLTLYQNFVDYVAKKMGKTPVCLQRDTYLQVNDLVRSGRCDLALVCTYAYVRGEKEFGMEALVVPQINGVTTYHSLILTPKSSTAESLLDLQGTRFGSADLLSNSGWLYPVTWLEERGKNPDTFFKEHLITGSHDRSVMAVASGYVDGAAVDSLVFEQLAVAFNRMTEALEQYRQEVQERERTRQLLIEKIVHAREEERKNISRELHDELGQSLLALLLAVQTSCAENCMPEDVCGDIQNRVRKMIDEVRRLAWGMRPSILDDYGLDSALARHVEELTKHFGLAIDYQYSCSPGLGRLPRDIEVTLYRVAQEALTNIVRHGRAQQVSAIVLQQKDEVTLLIEDDGCGFDLESEPEVSGAGPGLIGMRERVALLGGPLQ